MPKFLHAADLHIDSPREGLEQHEGAPVERIRAATRRALENLVALALDERVAFVVLAGDVLEHEPVSRQVHPSAVPLDEPGCTQAWSCGEDVDRQTFRCVPAVLELGVSPEAAVLLRARCERRVELVNRAAR